MMMVGDLLKMAAGNRQAFVAWLEQENEELATRCREAAKGQPLDMWVRSAVTWFELHASGDDWADLTSRIRESRSPGNALLATMVERRLRSCDCAVQGDAE